MLQRIDSITSTLFGDPRRFALEHRIFNTISLLFALANVGGAFVVITQQNYMFLMLLNLGTGFLFLVFYFLARYRGGYDHLYWPFVLLILGFLFVNSLQNAGSQGGAHYYFITALVTAVVLSSKPRRTFAAVLLFGGAFVALLYVEDVRPEWIAGYASPRERLFDVAGNLLFIQVFTAILVQTLTHNLNQERRKSDGLLRNVLPESIALELKATERVRPVAYDSATVLFTDFVGFTQIAENFTPQQLIEKLDGCFSQFDRLTRKHRLEKIKTIGDAYMAVGGVPRRNNTHAVDCVLAALEIMELVSKLRAQEMAKNEPYWQIRVGIHSGDLVAGVVGSEKFSYDVWGDTVNTASRLESSGVAGRINISAETYEFVKDFFDCEFRGKVAAKHKGEIDMYFVNAIREDLSVAGDGRLPNKRFMEMYNNLDQVNQIRRLQTEQGATAPALEMQCELF